MSRSFKELVLNYQQFKQKHTESQHDLLNNLATYGQNPEVMCITCSDSRIDPKLLFQCDPGDIFMVRNIANLVPPYEKDEKHHGTSAALEFGICHLNVKNLIIMGHSQCGGIQAKMNPEIIASQNDFISHWMGSAPEFCDITDTECCAKESLKKSHQNALGFPWIKERVDSGQLRIHLWFFDIKQAQISYWDVHKDDFLPLEILTLTKPDTRSQNSNSQ